MLSRTAYLFIWWSSIKSGYCAYGRILKRAKQIICRIFLPEAGFFLFIKFVKVLLSNARFILLTVTLLYTPAIT